MWLLLDPDNNLIARDVCEPVGWLDARRGFAPRRENKESLSMQGQVLKAAAKNERYVAFSAFNGIIGDSRDRGFEI